ncbi:MAG TPA: ABC transporter permease [Gemmatimonadaceae bacterium]|nr:ABC transporter permease [Gemmatimonadaceae bacterium]
MLSLVQDVRAAWRSLWRAPVVAVAAVLTLALGLGANVAMFGAVSAALLRPLPFPQPDRLVLLTQQHHEPGRASRPTRWSYPEFVALRRTLRGPQAVAAYYADDMNLAGGGVPVRVRAEMVSASYFDVLGVRPALGRAFAAAEDAAPGSQPVVLLSDALWRREFGGDPRVLGRTVLLNGRSLAVIGVLPAGFRGLTNDADVWITHAMAPAAYFAGHLTSSEHFLSVVARLRPGVTPAQAAAEVAGAGTRAAAAAHVSEDDEVGTWSAGLQPLDTARRDPAAARTRLVLAGAVGFVLLMAAVNLGGVLLARAAGRERELVLRAALGAGRARLVRLLALDGVLLATMGGGLGLLVAAWGVDVLRLLPLEHVASAPARGAQLATFGEATLDGRVLAFAALLTLATGVGAALWPALRATRGALAGRLASGGRAASARVGTVRRPTTLAVVAMAQVALAFVLLTGATLLLDGVRRMHAMDAGVSARNVLTARLAAPEWRYGGDRAVPLLGAVLERVRAVPGVLAASVSRCTPYMPACSSTVLYDPARPGVEPPSVGRHYVGEEHFAVLDVPLRRGRLLTAADRAGAPRVAVVNETAARTLWPGEDPIGKRVWFGSGGGFASPDSLTEIVGVVGDVLYDTPGARVGPDVYTSYRQFTYPETMLLVRTSGDPHALVPELRRAIAAVDPALPIYDVRTLDERAGDAIAAQRTAALLLGAFAALGLLLAALGVYGVMAYAVAQRRREIGVRVALGATRGAVLRLVLGQAGALAAVGLVVGSAAALGLSRFLAFVVADVRPDRPLPHLLALVILGAVALVACLLPARAAARVEPVVALRE